MRFSVTPALAGEQLPDPVGELLVERHGTSVGAIRRRGVAAGVRRDGPDRPRRLRRPPACPTQRRRHAMPSLLSVMKRRPGSERVHSSTRAGSTGAPVVRWRCSPTSPRSQPIADRAGTELRPVVVDRRGVRELEPGAVGAPRRSGAPRSSSRHRRTPRWHGTASAARTPRRCRRRCPSSWYRPPSRRSPVTGKNHRGIRSAFVHRVPHVVDVGCVGLRERHGAGLAHRPRSPAGVTAPIWWSSSITTLLLSADGPTRPLAARELGAEGRERRRPEAAEAVEPLVDVLQARRDRRRRAGARPRRGRSRNPCSRSTRRCWDTAGCEMPNSRWTTLADRARRPLAVGHQLQDRAAGPGRRGHRTLPRQLVYQDLLIFVKTQHSRVRTGGSERTAVSSAVRMACSSSPAPTAASPTTVTSMPRPRSSSASVVSGSTSRVVNTAVGRGLVVAVEVAPAHRRRP